MSNESPRTSRQESTSPTRFFIKGLAISLPPILTLVILLWVASAVNTYLVRPTSAAVRWTIAKIALDKPRKTSQLEKWDALPPLGEDIYGRSFRITPQLKTELQNELRQQPTNQPQAFTQTPQIPLSWIENNLVDEDGRPQVFVAYGDLAVPYEDYLAVARRLPPAEMPDTAVEVYMELVTIRYFGSQFFLIAVAVSVLVILLYFLGRFVTARVGAWAVHTTETAVLGRLPLISQVYSSVKQVTDFFFTDTTVEYNRVVAVQYPRRGVWSLGFVTGDSMLDMTAAAREPLLSVLMPTSPMPMTGFTINVPRSEVIDLDITVDQAFQFCLSCGVLIPDRQRVTPELLQEVLTRRLAGDLQSAAQHPAAARHDHPPGPSPSIDVPSTDKRPIDNEDSP